VTNNNRNSIRIKTKYKNSSQNVSLDISRIQTFHNLQYSVFGLVLGVFGLWCRGKLLCSQQL